MRYYDIKITRDGQLVQAPSLKDAGLSSTFTSYTNGQNLGAALNVDIDFPIVNYAEFGYGSHLSVWGLGLKELAQAFDLNSCHIVVEAGFKKGLPLATSAAQYAGIILEGTIFQAYGNWIGTNQKIDMILMPDVGTGSSPANIQLVTQPNQPMAAPIKQALESAYSSKGFTVEVHISSDLVFSYQQPASYPSLQVFATFLKDASQAQQFKGIKTLSGTPYTGIDVAIRGKVIAVTDGTQNYGQYTFDSPKEIAFQDIIGQCTWIDPSTMNFKTVMRADINIGDYIKLPQEMVAPYATLSPNAAQGAQQPASQARNKINFQGKFLVNYVHHFGNFRQADAASWVTSYNCALLNPPT